MNNYPLGVPGSSLDRHIENGCDANYMRPQECDKCNEEFPASYEMNELYSYLMRKHVEVCDECAEEIREENEPLSVSKNDPKEG